LIQDQKQMQTKALRRGLRTVLRGGVRGFDRLMERGYYRLNLTRSRWQAARAVSIPNRQYARYISEQLGETLRKKRLRNEIHFDRIPLIDLLAQHTDIRGKSILCVGCRNRDELVCFRNEGAADVVGIDLYSDHPDILIMDMHELRFPDRIFDVVYSRHSFEHAFDRRKAGQEFVRVLRDGGVVVIEVPGNYKGGADCNIFTGFEDVFEAFTPHVGEILFKEYSRKEDNTNKMDIIRLIFRVAKPTGQRAPR
jgi:SAM-dependent methyltransferase